MNKYLTGTVAGLVAIGSVVTAVPASAQYYRDSDRDGRPDRVEWNRDRDRDGRPDQWDRRDNRRDRHQWRYYGGRYGYNGYDGRWRSGQRYAYYRDNRYWVRNWRAYDLPPPHPGYRYYRDRNGDIVMAAVATGVIALIIGGALSGR